jgi:hypothetical protein
MSLPSAWTERLFAKLAVTYGQSFLRQYDGVDIEAVKANWGQELGAFAQNPKAIARGLELLPADRAPTVLQFKALCKGQAEHDMLALPAPPSAPVSPEVLTAIKAAVKPTSVGSKDWARALKEREARGPGLTLFQRKAWRTALGETGDAA